jgi:hypothetical protein
MKIGKTIIVVDVPIPAELMPLFAPRKPQKEREKKSPPAPAPVPALAPRETEKVER